MTKLFRYKYAFFDARYVVWSNGVDEDAKTYHMPRGFWKVRISVKTGSILWKEFLFLW